MSQTQPVLPIDLLKLFMVIIDRQRHGSLMAVCVCIHEHFSVTVGIIGIHFYLNSI